MDSQAAIIKTLFEQYYIRLCSFAYKITGSMETARDLAQDAFVVLIEQMDVIGDEPEKIKSYLYRVVKNDALNMLRHEKTAERIHKLLPFTEYEDEPITKAIIHAEVIGELHAAIDELPPACAQIFRLAYFEGKRIRKSHSSFMSV